MVQRRIDHTLLSVITRSGRSRRIFAREEQSLLTCSLGDVLDLSKGGARIFSRKKPFTGQKELQFQSRLGTLNMDATIAWSSKLGWRRYMLGVQFIGVSPRKAHLLEQIMQAHKFKPAEAA